MFGLLNVTELNQQIFIIFTIDSIHTIWYVALISILFDKGMLNFYFI